MSTLKPFAVDTEYGPLTFSPHSDRSGWAFGGQLHLRGTRYDVAGTHSADQGANVWFANTKRRQAAAPSRIRLMEDEIDRAFRATIRAFPVGMRGA